VLVPPALVSGWLSHAAGLERELVLADVAGLVAWSGSASFPAELLLLQPSSSREAPFLADVLPATRRVQRRALADEPKSWRETRGLHQVLDIDPQWLRCVRVRVSGARSGTPRLSWHSDEGAPSSTAEGAWIQEGETRVALFDLAREPRWLLCGRVRSISLEGPGAEDAQYEVVRALPEPALVQAPQLEGGRLRAQLAAAPLERLEWQLVLFDPRALESRVLDVRTDTAGELVFELPADWSARAGLEWSLEASSGKACVARVSGKR